MDVTADEVASYMAVTLCLRDGCVLVSSHLALQLCLLRAHSLRLRLLGRQVLPLPQLGLLQLRLLGLESGHLPQ